MWISKLYQINKDRQNLDTSTVQVYNPFSEMTVFIRHNLTSANDSGVGYKDGPRIEMIKIFLIAV